ncbi:hypothetical protein ON010_g1820 [Phytophthora cinnamomi]|nr:hypothetical protein ON010_g1820 [Phytophthora cinnamomi]
MIRTRRSLKTMATCSDVTTCLSEGSTECSLSSKTCPPCVYALTGGDYSCYSRDTSGDCPFSGTYAECDKSSSSSSTKKSTSTSTSSKDSSSSDTTPKPTTKTPAKTTATPSTSAEDTPSPETPSPETPAPETPSTGTTKSGTSGAATSSQNNSGDSTYTTQATTAPSTTTASADSDVTQSSKSDNSDNGTEKALTSSTTTTTGSPAVVNLALIGGAVVFVVIVIAFVARRVVRKKKMAHSQERTVTSQNSAWSDRTLGTNTSGGNLYSTYSYKDEAGKANVVSMADSQTSSTYGPAYAGQAVHSSSSPRPTADFSTYGGESNYSESNYSESNYSESNYSESQYSETSQYTGPELLPVGEVAGHYGDNNMPPSARSTSNFVNVTASSMRGSELDSIRSGQQPLTVSQLMPTSIGEDEEEAYASRRPAPRAYNIQTATPPVPPSTRTPQVYATSGVSATSSMRSDYDIVDPITMRDVEARNTEMLAENGQYPKFSFESEADIYDGSSSGEESSDDERVHQGEHTI